MKRSRQLAGHAIPAAIILLILWSSPAAGATPLAYVGPGAGLSMLGALAAVIGVVGLGLLGPLLYPLVWLKRWWHQRHRLRPENE